jgi:integrase
MVEQLHSRGEQDLLDAVCDGRTSLLQLWSNYRADATLDAAKADLDDLDLEPFVALWHRSLVARGIRSADEYLSLVRRFIPAGEALPRSQFTRPSIREFLDGLTKTPRAKPKKDDKKKTPPAVKGATRNRYRNALGVFARWLVQEHDGVLEFNPVTDVRRAKEPVAHVIYSPAEVRKLVESLTGDARIVGAVMATTGMEWQAVNRLRRRDVDLDAKTLHAHGSKNIHRDRTNAATEDWAWSIVAAHCDTLHPEAPLVTINHKPALEAHHAACAILGLPRTTMHAHRDHYAVMLRRRGVSDVVIARQLGHADTQLVARRYGRYQPETAEVTRAAGGLTTGKVAKSLGLRSTPRSTRKSSTAA